MEKLQLNEREIDFFFDMFDKYDSLRCGKLKVETVKQILAFSGLSSDDLIQIINLSDAIKTGYFGRSHFFTALKLVALVQNGYGLTLDSLSEHGFHNPDEHEETSESPNFIEVHYDGSTKAIDIPPVVKQSCSLKSGGEQSVAEDSTWTSKYEDEERGLLSGEQAKKSSDILASFNIEKSQRGQTNKAAKSNSQKSKELTLSDKYSSILHSSSSSSHLSSDTLTSISSPSVCSSNRESPNMRYVNSKAAKISSPWAYHDLNGVENKVDVPEVAEPNNVEISGITSQKRRPNVGLSKEKTGSFCFKSYLSNHPGSPQFASEQKLHKSDRRRRRWINSFALNPKREAEYVMQFNELFISTDSNKTLVSPSEVTQLFGAQFNLSASDFEKIWTMADLDHDGFLNKTEFCLASHLARLHTYEGLSLEDAIEASASYVSHLGLQTQLRVNDGSPQMSPDSAEYPLMYLNRPDQDFSSENEQIDGHDMFSSRCSNAESSRYELIETALQDPDDRIDNDPNYISQGICIDPDDSDSLNESVDDHGDAALLPKHKSSTEFISCKDIPHSPNGRDKYANINRNLEGSNSRSSSSCSFYESSDLTDSPLSSDSTSDSDPNTDDRISSNSRNFSTRHRVNRSVDPIHLLSVTTGRQTSALSSLSSVQRRRLLCSLIREAKSLNHTLLRLNNEMQGELKELNDQRVNLSVQLQHLGLHPSKPTF